jgi:hypothetical protein
MSELFLGRNCFVNGDLPKSHAACAVEIKPQGIDISPSRMVDLFSSDHHLSNLLRFSCLIWELFMADHEIYDAFHQMAEAIRY